MEIYVKKLFDFRVFFGFKSQFYHIYIDFALIAASNTASEDVTN